MAETLKFGAGEWATKEGSTLAYNSENGNFKPLPFTFDRSTSATRVNKEGLIEVVPNNEPRIDFLNDSNGALLLEPTRSNLMPYSDFTNSGWTKSNTTVTLSSELSPIGMLNAYDVVYASGGYILESVSTTKTIGSSETISVFSKSDIVGTFLKFGGGTASGTDVEKKEDYGNGWFRYSVTRTFTEAETGSTQLIISSTDIGLNATLFGPQLEQGSYATSYIPTQGSIGTRVEEDIALTLPDDASFNSSNGFSLYGEFLTNGGSGSSSMALQFNANSGYFGFGHNGSGWRARINDGTDNELHNSSASILSVGKLALSFNSSGFNMYANGSSFASGNTDMSAITSADSIVFRDTDEFGSFRIRDLKLYNTRLTDQELINLTKI